jgi:type II secretory pathway pseudopilin PulG
LIELFIVLALILFLTLLGLPALLRMLERQKAYSTATELAQVLRLARLEAIKRSNVTGVTVDYQTREATAFVDVDNDQVLSPPDISVAHIKLATGIEPWGPEDGAAGGNLASVSFPENGEREGTALFGSNGAALVSPGVGEPAWGAFRLKGRDKNYFEVRVFPPAVGRISVRKWVGGDHSLDASWRENGQGGKAWRWVNEGEDPVPY